MWVFILAPILLIILSVELHYRFGRSGRLIRKIPGPKAFPIIGNILTYFVTPEKLFLIQRSLSKLYGHVNQIHILNIRMVNLSDPDDIEKLMTSFNSNHKEHPYKYLVHWLGRGLLTSNGPTWIQRRKMLTKAFHFNTLKKFFVTFGEEADFLLERVQDEVGKQRTDLFTLMSSTTLRIMCESAFGTDSKDIESLVNKYFTSLEVMGDCFTQRLTTAWLHSEPIYQLTNTAKKENVAVKHLHTLTDSVVRKRREYLAHKNFNHFDHDDSYEYNGKLAMLDLLLKNEKAGILDHQAVREEVDTFMFAGHDTTATAMTFIIMALANEPEIQDKAYAEICRVLGNSDRPVTAEDLNQMKYLECCIKESLRLYPSAPVIARHIEKETVYGGYKVPANSAAFIYIIDIHRRADLYPEPERFIPERFLPENCSKRHPFAYIPFSAGSRNCIGQKFAMMELKTMMSKLMRKYCFEPVTRPADVAFKTDIVLRTAQPIYVKFCQRL